MLYHNIDTTIPWYYKQLNLFWQSFNVSISKKGYVEAALILGGVDKHGSHIYTIHPHGSTDRLPYTTMGSGSLAAMTVFESRWKPNMKVRKLVVFKYILTTERFIRDLYQWRLKGVFIFIIELFFRFSKTEFITKLEYFDYHSLKKNLYIRHTPKSGWIHPKPETPRKEGKRDK